MERYRADVERHKERRHSIHTSLQISDNILTLVTVFLCVLMCPDIRVGSRHGFQGDGEVRGLKYFQEG